MITHRTETKIYIGAFLTVLFIACLLIANCEGKASESLHQHDRGNALLVACMGNNAILQRRYDLLADNSDWLQVVDAERKYQIEGKK